MDSIAISYLERAKNEIILSDAIMALSTDTKIRELLKIPTDAVFHSAIISHSYYAIFHSAKAILLTKGIRTQSPNVHNETLNAFKSSLVDTGLLDYELFKIYKKTAYEAIKLYGIFSMEKRKRGTFTYTTLPQAEHGFATESIRNSKYFYSKINAVLAH
jgi:uncharacterized protein (UPF0332 family)